jgi:hypothetical protein
LEISSSEFIREILEDKLWKIKEKGE